MLYVAEVKEDKFSALNLRKNQAAILEGATRPVKSPIYGAINRINCDHHSLERPIHRRFDHAISLRDCGGACFRQRLIQLGFARC